MLLPTLTWLVSSAWAARCPDGSEPDTTTAMLVAAALVLSGFVGSAVVATRADRPPQQRLALSLFILVTDLCTAVAVWFWLSSSAACPT